MGRYDTKDCAIGEGFAIVLTGCPSALTLLARQT